MSNLGSICSSPPWCAQPQRVEWSAVHLAAATAQCGALLYTHTHIYTPHPRVHSHNPQRGAFKGIYQYLPAALRKIVEKESFKGQSRE